MKISGLVMTLVTSAFASKSSESPVLRGNNKETAAVETHRNLQTVTFDQIISLFTPFLDAAISAALDTSLDPMELQMTVTSETDIAFSENCTAPATITYTIGALTGLSGFAIENMVLVPGSGSIQVSALRGTTWQATFQVAGDLPALQAPVTVDVKADACGTPISQSASGVLTAGDAGVDFTLRSSGFLPGLLSLGKPPSVSALAFSNADVSLGTIETNLALDTPIATAVASNINQAVSVAIEERIVGPFLDLLNRVLGVGFNLI